MVADKFRIFAVFAPVDEDNTMIYMRFYHRFTSFPPAKELINYLGKKLVGIILGQDKRAVITQLPIKTSLKMDEKLIHADRPIIEYRRHRDELLKTSK